MPIKLSEDILGNSAPHKDLVFSKYSVLLLVCGFLAFYYLGMQLVTELKPP
jgi:hypothetical protein